MQENQGGGGSCGKACMWTCGGCAIVIVLFVLMTVIGATCFGCTVCAGMSSLFGGLFQAIGHVSDINTYFEDLEDEGWDVDFSDSNQPSGYGASVDDETPMIWRARESGDDEWIEYVWTFGLDEGALEELESMDEDDFDFSMLGEALKFTLLPRTEAALEVHEELGIPLPDDFELQPLDEDGGRRPDRHDRDRDRDDETDEDDEEPRRRQKDGKSFRIAA